jgi:tRNA modification GTPase
VEKDTIVAIATPPGRGGVGIIRVSGPNVKHIAKTITGQLPQPRYATFTTFKSQQQIIDEGLILFFPSPHSFTGEDVIELHGHGGPVVLDQLLQYILQLGARLARPGEFSERAFLNDKIDLTQAEAIADLINATSAQAARSAVQSLQGKFSNSIHEIVKDLIHLRMMVEAAIDFPEEEIDFLTEQGVGNKLEKIISKIVNIRKSAKQGTLLQEGIKIVIAGKPNAGKSSLLNSLVEKEAAIVTDIAGTTRDVLREYINLDGLPLHIIDTAGLRQGQDIVEQEGVRRAKQEIKNADIILLVVDSSDKTKPAIKESLIEFIEEDMQNIPIVIIKNKIDLTGEDSEISKLQNYPVIKLSVKENKGLDSLKEYIKKQAGFIQTGEGQFIARRRHLDCIDQAIALMQKGHEQLESHHAGELLAEDLRLAQQSLNEITGEFTSDDLLGKIFSSFCIGK